MKYQPYPQYKDSGVEWLGEIPVNWCSSKLSWCVQETRPITYGIVQCGPDVAPSGIPYIRPVDMSEETGILQELQHTTPEIALPYKRSSLYGGDIVISIGPSFGKVMITPNDLSGANLTQGTARVAIVDGFDRKFFFWVLRSSYAKQFWTIMSSGATFAALTLDNLCRTPIALPSPSIQRIIASFLDTETARIDGLVKDYEELIELLKEKRQALISHAVTRGLSELVSPDDPEFGEWAKPVTFKDSGVEWIGEIPEGWEVARLSYLASVENGATPSRSEARYWTTDENGIPWLGSGEVNQYKVFNCTERITATALNDCSLRLLPIGTIILGIVGEGKTRGISAKLCIEATINQNLAAIIPSEKLDVDYLHFTFQASYSYLRDQGRGGNQAALNCEIVSAFKIPSQGMQEQRAIASFLDRETAKIDALVSESESAIELLKEHRSALITNAVTGKINVENIA